MQLGFHDFIALFPGDNVYAPSTSPIDNVVVNNVPTVTLRLVGAPNPGILGQNVAFTATSPIPTGGVTLLDSGTAIAFVPLTASGVAVFNTNALIIGVHTIQATYSGDTNYASQSATVSEVIRYPPAAVTLSSSLNPATVGQSVMFTARTMVTGPVPRAA